MTYCNVEGCEKILRSDNKTGYCKKHRYLLEKATTVVVFCSVENCENILRSDNRTGYCKNHKYLHKRVRPKQGTTPKELIYCLAEGCEKILRSNNNTGYCKKHRHLSEKVKARQRVLGKEWYYLNAEKARSQGRNRKNKQYALNPDKFRQIKRELYLEDPEKVLKRNKVWRDNNPEKIQEGKKKQYLKNPEPSKRNSQTRRARKADAFIEEIDRFSVWCRDAGLCFICGFPADKNNWWLEHVIPLARGGLHCYDNVAVSHQHCNNRKYDRLIDELDGSFDPWDDFQDL